MTRKFADRVAIVTGASSGIGWYLAENLADQGARVGLIARRADLLETLAARIAGRGGQALAASADVGDRSSIRDAIQTLRTRLGPVDLLIANAGVGMPTHLDPLNVCDVEQMFRVNLLGAIYAVEAVISEMLERRRGHL